MEAKFRGGPRWYKGTIARANRDGTYDIEYDDGDAEQGVADHMIRVAGRGAMDDSAISTSPTRTTRGASPGFSRNARGRGPSSSASSSTKRIELIDKLEAKATSQRDIDRFMQAFEAADRKATGTVHARDFGRILKSLRIDFNPGDLREALQNFGDGRTSVDYHKLLGAIQSQGSGGVSPSRGREPTSESDDGGQVFSRGDRVEARYKNGRKYFPGVIKRSNGDGTYQIAYDDGDAESNVDGRMIRLMSDSSVSADDDPLQSGGGGSPRGNKEQEAQRIADMLGRINTTEKRITDLQDSFEMLDQDGSGKIMAREFERNVDRARLGIPFSLVKDISSALGSDGKVRYSILIKALRIASGQSGRSSSSPTKRGSPARSSSRERSSSMAEADIKFRPGQRIEARMRKGRKYFPGVIERERPDGTYDIMYDDGDTETRVSSIYIRASLPTVDSMSALGEGAIGGFGDSAEFNVGDKVEARFKGGRNFFKGTIEKVNRDGSCDIAYADGDFERRVAPENIRQLDTPDKLTNSNIMGDESDDQAPIRAGDRVEALYKRGTKWYPGTVDKVYPSGACDISYDDGDQEKRVSPRNVRRIAKSTGSRQASRGGRNSDLRGRRGMDTDEDVSDFDDGPGSQSSRFGNRNSSKQERLQRGAAVEALFKGGRKWYKGKVLRANPDGSYAISYDDGDRELKVPAEMVRSLEPASSFNDEGSGATSFKVGQNIEARFRGRRKYFQGIISRVNRDGTYAIDYADGDQERAVDASMIRALGGSPRGGIEVEEPKQLQRGDLVEARYKGGKRFYKGKIMRVNINGTYDIAYDDGDRERGVSAEDVRSLKEATTGRGDREGGRDPPGLRVGSLVEARYQRGRKWFKGKITRVNTDGSFNIAYDDGDQETRVPASLVRSLEDEGTETALEEEHELSRGDLVEALFKNGRKYYKGKIVRRNSDGTYAIHYDDGDRELRVSRDKIRPLGDPDKFSTRSKSPSRTSRGFGDESPIGEIQRGDRVEARFRGGRKYFKGKIMRVNADGTYDIAYDDGDRDRSVPAEHIKKGEEDGRSPHSSPSRQRKGYEIDTDDEFENNQREGRSAGLKEGMRVEAQFRGGAKYYKGRVTRVYANGSADIAYDDGDKERMVSASKIRSLDSPSSPRNNRSKADDEELMEGDRVEAPYRGGRKYYKGKISRVNRDGTCDIAFDDGDRERNIVKESIRKLASSPRHSTPVKLRRGDRVEAKYKNGKRYYKGTVDRTYPDGSCDIKYEDGDFERRVIAENIKPLDNIDDLSGGRGSRSPRSPRSPRSLRDRSPRSRSAQRGMETETEDETDEIKEGDRVEARFKGGAKYYPGKITRVNRDGSYAILYDDGDRELRVKPSFVRAKGGNQRRSVSPRRTTSRDREPEYSETESEEIFRQGDRVEARFKGKAKYYKGKIVRVRANGTYDIAYDDGDRETHVEATLIRRMGRERSSSPSRNRKSRDRDEYSDSETNDENGHELAELLGRILKKGFRTNAMRNYQEVFDSIDVNGDGFVSRLELGRALDKLGLRYTSTELRSMVRLLDRNGDGRLSYREFVQLLKRSDKSSSSSPRGRSRSKSRADYSSDESSDDNDRTRRRRSPRRQSHSRGRSRARSRSRSPTPSASDWSESDIDGDDAWDSDGEDAAAGGVVVRNFENYVGKVILKDTRKRFKTAFERADSHSRGYIYADRLQSVLGKIGIRKRISGNLQKKLARKYGRGTKSKIFYRDLVAGCKEAASNDHDDESHAARIGRLLPRLQRAVVEHDVDAQVREQLDKDGQGTVERKDLSKLLGKIASIKRAEKVTLLEFLANFLGDDGKIKYDEVLDYIRNSKTQDNTPGWKRATSNVDIQKGIAALRAEKERMEKEGVDPLVFQVMRKLQQVVSDALHSGAVGDYSDAFELFDLDKDGIVTHAEMTRALAELGFDLSPEETSKVLLKLDPDGTGEKMDYRHFLMFVTRGSDRDQWALSSSGALVGTTYAGEMESSIRHKLRKIALQKRSGYSTILRAFKNVDKDSKGYVSKKSLRKVASNQGWALSHEDLACLCARFDLRGEDKFAYKQFVSFLSLDDDAVYGVEQRIIQFVASMSEQGAGLRECFNVFDRNGDGKISASELGSAMIKIGFPVSQEESAELIRRVDVDRDGKISFVEFVRAFGPNAASSTTFQSEQLVTVDENSRSGENSQQNAMMNPSTFLTDWTDGFLIPQSKLPLAPKGSVGEWLETTASPLEKRNFFAFLHLISNFEKRLGLEQHGDVSSGGKEAEDLVLQLGTKLKVSMKFLNA